MTPRFNGKRAPRTPTPRHGRPTLLPHSAIFIWMLTLLYFTVKIPHLTITKVLVDNDVQISRNAKPLQQEPTTRNWQRNPRVNYTRYQNSLPERLIKRSIISYGDRTYTNKFFTKFLSGKPISIGVIGGSISHGRAAEKGINDYSTLVHNWIASTFPLANHSLVNGAVPAVNSVFMSLCYYDKIPQHVDLVLVELNVNDGIKRGDNPRRRAHEQLLRGLLSLPNRPAVLEILLSRWFYPHELAAESTPYRNTAGDEDIIALSHYYHLPIISQRSALYHTNAATTNTKSIMAYTQAANWTQWINPRPGDRVHPNVLGHRYIADMIIQYLQDGLEYASLNSDDSAGLESVEELPRPMYKGNYEVKNKVCVMDDDFKALVTNIQGFNWVNEGQADRPKVGFVSFKPGDWVRLKVNTNNRALGSSKESNKTSMYLAYLSSQEMGTMLVKCVQGCSCEAKIDLAASAYGYALTTLTSFEVKRQSDKCEFVIKVLNETRSAVSNHKVKVSGLALTS